MKLDAKFYGEIKKVKDDTIVPEDEWCVFLAKDNAFAAILPQFVLECIKRGCDEEQIAAIKRMVERVTTWRDNNQDKLKDPDAKGDKLIG
jgi:hypothetical protein